ncbi:MAG: AAA family ATPase [Anaerolineales bacterium]
MLIKQIELHGFGKLKGQVQLKPGLNAVLAPNRWGKSTLLASIVALMYGLDRSRKSKSNPVPELSRYRPWAWQRYGAAMELELDDGRRLRVEKDFGHSETRVLDLKTGKRAEREFEYSKELQDYRIGDALLDMPRSIFESAVVIPQHALQRGLESIERAKVKSSLEALIDVAGGGRTAGEAVAALTDAIDSYPGRTAASGGKIKTATEISRLQENLDSLEGELRELEAKRMQSEENLATLDEMSRDLAFRRAELQAIEVLLTEAELHDLETSLANLQALTESKENLSKEIEDLKLYDAVHLEDEKKILEAHAEHRQALRQVEIKIADRQRLERERDEVNHEIEHNFGGLGQAAPESLKRAVLSIGQWRLAVKRHDDVRISAESEKSSLASKGIKVEDFERLVVWIEAMPDTVATLLAAQAEDVARIQHEIHRLREQADLLGRRELNASVLETRRRRVALALGTLASVLILASLWIWVGSSSATPQVVAMGMVGILLGVIGSASWLRARRALTDEHQKIDENSSAIGDLEEEHQALDNNVSQASILAGYSIADISTARDRHRMFQRLREQCESYLNARRDLDSASNEITQIAEEIRPFMEMAGVVTGEQVDESQFRELESRLESLDVLERRMGKLRERIGSLSTDLDRDRATVSRTMDSIRSITAMLPVEVREETDTAAELVGIYDRAAKAKKGLDQYRDELARVDADLASIELSGSELTARIEVKKRRLDDLSQGVESLVSEIREDVPIDEWRERLGVARAKVEAAQNSMILHRDDLRETLKETDDISSLRARRSELSQELEAVRGFDETVRLAIETIQSVSSGTYHEWANHLNSSVEGLLETWTDEYRDVEFHDDLSFSLYSAEKQGRLTEEETAIMLSGGAKAVIYLAIRLAMVNFFSRREKVPLIFDDSFVDLDDQIFEEVLSVIAKQIAKDNQVILLTCHENQYGNWFDTQGDLGSRIVELKPLKSDT